jgi:hypothetical protein
LSEGEGAGARLAARALWIGNSAALGKGCSLALGAPLEPVDLGAQPLNGCGQLANLTLLMGNQPHQVFSAQRGYLFRGLHGVQYRPLVVKPQARPLIYYD